MAQFCFERIRFCKSPEIETVVIDTGKKKFTDDKAEQELNLAFKLLFKKYPHWGKGTPTKNGVGWSSAVIRS